MKLQNTEAPKHLYKIVPLEQWQASQTKDNLVLSPEDTPYIRFLKEDELGRTLHYWIKINAAHVVLKIKANKLVGRLVFEPNPGGSAKQYHLYNGSIAMSAIVEAKITQLKTN